VIDAFIASTIGITTSMSTIVSLLIRVVAGSLPFIVLSRGTTCTCSGATGPGRPKNVQAFDQGVQWDFKG
jgi:hypothetical protein